MNPPFSYPATTMTQRALIEQIVGDPLIGSPHHIDQGVSRSVKPVVNLDFSVRPERGGTA